MPTPFPELETYLPGARQPKQPSTSQPPSTWLDLQMDAERDRQIREGIFEAPKPDAVARTEKLARDIGSPVGDVQGNEDYAEKAIQARNLADLALQHAPFGKWAVSNPRGAAMAADDTKSLGALGTAWDFLSNLPGRFVSAGIPQLGSLAAKTWGTIEGVNETVQAPINMALSWYSQAAGMPLLDPTAALEERAQRRQQNFKALDDQTAAGRAAYQGGNMVSEGLLQGIDSLPMTVAALLTRNPELATGTMGTLVGGGAYQDAKSKGLSTASAIPYAVLQGGTEAITEKIPAGTLVDLISRKTPFGTALVRELGQELVGENVATFVQDMTDWAYLPENQSKTFGDFLAARPQAAIDTSLAVLGGSGTTVGMIGAVHRAADATVSVAGRMGEARQARGERSFVDRAAKAAEASKLRQRDPEAFRDLIRTQAEAAGAGSVFIPGDAIREYKQSEGYDPDVDPFDPSTWEEAAGSGGDVVMPIEDFLTDVVGTPAYDAVKEDLRLSQGGMSSREAEEFDGSLDETIGKAADDMASSQQSEAKQRGVRDALVERLTAAFGESYTAPVARQYAEIAVQRAQTRASRLGMDLTGNEFDDLTVRQVLPEGVAQAVQADKLDLVINAMRKGKDAEYGVGPSLLEFIKQRGGINDVGGDLASMGVPKKYLTGYDPRQAELTGGLSGQGDYGLDNTLRAAIEAGYFPDLANVENEAGPSTLDTQRLLDAIGEELASRPTHAEIRTDDVRASADDLRQTLEDAGYSPSQMTDAEVRDAVNRMVTEATPGGYEQEARGRIIFDQNKTIIELFQSRNLSTALHEMGHMWLEELRVDAALPEAPEQVVADWAAVQAWFARAGHPLDETGAIPVDAHELFARGIETYFMEGKAPSSSLTRIFENVRQWMISLYKNAAALRAPITPQVREVFDRMLATDDEIAATRERQGIEMLFKDAASIGMSEAEFAAYQANADAARSDSHAKLLDKTMRAIRRRETERYREARKGVRAEEVERIDASPVYRALAAMKADRVSKEWIVDRLGLDATELLPKRVPPLFVDGGVNPDVVAEMAGYSSGQAMIEALIGAERAHRQAKEGGDQRSMRERAIETATDEEMNRRYGDPLNDGSIEREALAAVESDLQGEVIAAEIRALGRQTGRAPTPYQIARQWARNKVRTGTVEENASPGAIQRYARNAAKASRAAEQAMLKGDLEEAYRQKQFQMLNSALVAEAKAAYDDVGAAVKRMDKIARAQTRKSVDQDYLEQAQALLEAVDLRRRTQIYEKRKGGFAAWAQAREAEGYDVVVPDSFAETIGQTNWTKLPVETLLTLDETVKQIMHLGRLKQSLLDNQEEREWDAVKGEIMSNLMSLPQREPDPNILTVADKAAGRLRSVHASLVKMRRIIDRLDNGNIAGPLNRMIIRPLAEAQYRSTDMQAAYGEKDIANLKTLPPEIIKRIDDRISVPELPGNGGDIVWTRAQLWQMAKNVGNPENLRVLEEGYGWEPGAALAALDRHLSKAEWDYVQQEWDNIAELWPEIEAMYKRINGIAPPKIEIHEVVTQHGTYRGGYYPLVPDSTKNPGLDQRIDADALMRSAYHRAMTSNGFTNARTGAVYVVSLSEGISRRHMVEVIHDVTHREAIMQASKVLNDRAIKQGIRDTVGIEIEKQIEPWLKHIANQWAQERNGVEGMDWIASKLRSSMSMVGMGYRISTALSQIAGYTNSVEALGSDAEKWMLSGARSVTGMGWSTASDFVMERSSFVRQRVASADATQDAELKRLSGKSGLANDVRRFAFHLTGYMDRAVVVPTWLAAYNKAQAEGMSEEDSVAFGDAIVDRSQGSGGAMNASAIQRVRGVPSLFTLFYSYGAAYYNRQSELAYDAGQAIKERRVSDVPRLMARAWWLMLAPNIVTTLMQVAMGAGPDDDDNWAWWFALRSFTGVFAGVPYAREAANAILSGYDYSSTPLDRFGKTLIQAGADIWHTADDYAPNPLDGFKPVDKGAETNASKRALRNLIEAGGYATSLPTGQAAATTQFIVDWANGNAHPETARDWFAGLTTGKVPKN